MAKARKPKPEGAAGAGATVLHQKLCLSIDMENQLIYGYTEIKVLLAENDTFALHADSMTIRNILVDGEAAEFEYSPHWKNVDDQPSWLSVSCSKTAADAACSAYVSSLTSEAVPNLIISCERSVKSTTEQRGEENAEKHEENGVKHEENGGMPVQISDDNTVKFCNGSAKENDKEEEKENKKGEEKKNEKEEKNEMKKKMEKEEEKEDEKEKAKEMEEEKEEENENEKDEENEMQIENDKVLSKEDPPRKTYVYKLNTPVSAQWISLVVGPFGILPDRNGISVSHMCLSPTCQSLRTPISFFHDVYSCYEDYLGAPFPFGLYKQIFLPPEMIVLPTSLGASTCIFCSDILNDEKVIDQNGYWMVDWFPY